MDGPPIANTNSFWLSFWRGWPVWFKRKSFALRSSLRKNSKNRSLKIIAAQFF